MNAITFATHKKSGNYIKATVCPANRSQEPRFGLIDFLIVTFFVLSVGGLAYLLLLK
jgi:hypothetical protein